MTYKIIYPDNRLTNFVKFYWILEQNNELQHTERIVPTGYTQVIFHRLTPFQEVDSCGNMISQPQSVICGQVTMFKDVRAIAPADMIGIVFHPHTLKTFIPVPMNELTDLSVDASDVCHRFRELGNRIVDVNDVAERINVIENALLQMIRISNTVHFHLVQAGIERIQQRKGQISVTELRDELGTGERTFERLFQINVGVSPKHYIDITRLNHAMNLIKTPLSLTRIAYEAGYYDQAHFIRSFKRYTGLLPKAYRKTFQNS